MKFIKDHVAEWRILLLVFAYVVVVGLVLQKIILPLTPWHVGQGLMAGGDWIEFQKVAVIHATNISDKGWHEFVMKPEGHGPSGLAAFVYAMTGTVEPWALLPVNGAIYAVAALGLYWIVLALGASTRAALYALLPMLLMPSLAMVWGQLHKDVWSIAAVLLLLAFWARLFVGPVINCWASLVILFFSNASLWWMRPYTLQIVLFGQAAMLFVLAIGSYKNKKMLPLLAGIASIAITVSFLDLKKGSEVSTAEPIPCVAWLHAWHVPYVESALIEIACTRSRLFEYSKAATSNLDSEVAFHSAGDVLAYSPRAAQIGFFSPFPNMWFSEKASYQSQFFRAVAAVETLVMYVALLGVFLQFGLMFSTQSGVSREQFLATVALLFFSLIWVEVYALTTGNIGSIYRVRFPMMLLWIGMGVLAWQRVLGWLDLREQRKYG